MRFPKSWADVTIEQFQKGNEVLLAQYDEEIDRHIDLLNALSGIPNEVVLRLPRNKFMKAIHGLSFITKLDNIDRRFPLFFSLKGRIFKVSRRVDKLSTAQMAELSSFCSTEEETKLNLHKAMATICLPLLINPYGKRRAKKHEKSAEFLRQNLTMNIAWPIALFFCTVYASLMKNTLEDLLNRMGITMPSQLLNQQSSLKDTAG